MSNNVEAAGEVLAPPTELIFTGWLCYDPGDPEGRYASLYVTAEGAGIQPFRPTPVDPMRVVPVRVTIPL